MIPNDTDKSVECLNNELRGKLTALAWEITESAGKLNIKELAPDCLEKFQDEIYNSCDTVHGVSLEEMFNQRFHDKSISEWSDAFAHLDCLVPSHNNAFLFNTRNHN